MKPKTLILVIIALGCGLIASIGISQVMQNRGAETPQGAQSVDVFVATQPVSIGDELTHEMIKLESWPADKVPPGAIGAIEDVEGRRARQRLYAGEPIIEDKLISGNSLGGASELIPPGYRVATVPVSNAELGGLLLPGDRVDVLCYLRKSCDIRETQTKTVLRNVKVFAVNDKIDRIVGEEGGASIKAKSVSLLVKPDQDKKLLLAEKLGELSLSLRRGDEDPADGDDGKQTAGDFLGESSGDLVETDPPTKAGDPAPAPDQRPKSFLDFLKKGGEAVSSVAMAMPAAERDEFHMDIMAPGGVERWGFGRDGSLPRQVQTLGMGMTAPPVNAGPPMAGGLEPTAEPADDPDDSTGDDDLFDEDDAGLAAD